jgi:lysophospholipase L1-like esterase
LADEFGYHFLNLHPRFTDAAGELRADFTMDGLHVTEPGYQVWRSELEKTMGWNLPGR